MRDYNKLINDMKELQIYNHKLKILLDEKDQTIDELLREQDSEINRNDHEDTTYDDNQPTKK
jgi:hypothetical protein